MEDFSIGECSAYGEGVMLIVKNIATQNLLIMCDECETAWPNPEDALSNRNRIPYDLVPQVVDPTLAEVKAAGWDKFLTE